MFDALLTTKDIAITAAGNYDSKAIDLGANGVPTQGDAPISDPGRAVHGKVLAQVTDDLTGGTNVRAQIVMSDTVVDGKVSGVVTVLQETAAVPAANLKTGYQFRLDGLPPGISQRYLGIRLVSTGTFTAGKVTTGIVWDKPTNQNIG